MNKKIIFSLVLIIIVLAILVVGGILIYRGQRPLKSNEGIVIGNEFKTIYKSSPQSLNLKTSEYYCEIDKDIRTTFVPKEMAGFIKGDVVLEKYGNSFILLSNVYLFGPGGETFSVWATNNPDIIFIKYGTGDMAFWEFADYYLNIKTNKIVFSIQTGWPADSLTIKKNDSSINLDRVIIDKCGTGEEREGKKAQIVDLSINDNATNILSEPIEVNCFFNNEGIGPLYGYSPEFSFEIRKIESDFSKLYFNLVGIDIVNGVRKEVWKKEFYISFADLNNIKIYPENP